MGRANRARVRADSIAQQLLPPLPTRGSAQSLSGGAAGIALLHVERARTGVSTWDHAHAWLAKAASDTAEAAMTGCLNDPCQLQRIIDSGLCHGSAGLYMTVTAFAFDALHPQDLPLHHITELLLNRQPAADAPGFLTGRAGYALALHDLASDTPSATAWDACLLLR
ncbi:hypothetical protein AB0M95_26005 [Sphaerisporangium sp. NPDC051017]|uniref:hypothetical protein n=1 Tax=Sphaerisporangium sp. NPDC051017 TaxID=3154636 RepID=UPI00342C5A02